MPTESCFLRFWGVRGSLATPGPSTIFYGGNTSCVEVRADGEIIVLDAGTGIRPLGLALQREFPPAAPSSAPQPLASPLRVTVLITHTHWDHIQGFPFFLPAYQAGNQVLIAGYQGQRSVNIRQAIVWQMASTYFPIPLSEMRADVRIMDLTEMEFELGAVSVKAIQANHPGGAVGFRINTSCGSFGYMPDHEPFRYCPTGAELNGTKSEADQHKDESAAVKRNQLVEFMRGVDVLLMDSQYAVDEYEPHRGWGHGVVDDVVDLSICAGVKCVYLFHHDPEHNDETIAKMTERGRKIAKERGSDLIVEAAREGVIVTLPQKSATGETAQPIATFSQ